jgi:flagellar biosynthesis/type III secretory pathway protein FliH
LWSRVLKPEGVAWLPPQPAERPPEPLVPDPPAGESASAAYDRGRRDGVAAARAELGEVLAERLDAIVARQEELGSRLEELVRAAFSDLAGEVVDLALAAAERLASEHLSDPDALARKVARVLERFPRGTFSRLLAAPQQSAALHEAFAAFGLDVEAEAGLSVGSFYLEGAAERIDATLATAVQELRDALASELGGRP